jgi:hypothetical protein
LFHQITGGLNCTLVPVWIANDFYPDFASIKDRSASAVHCCGVQDHLPAAAGILATLARYLHLSNLIEIFGSSRPMLGFSRRNSARAVRASATKLPSSSLALIQYSKSGRPYRKTKSFVLMAGDD